MGNRKEPEDFRYLYEGLSNKELLETYLEKRDIRTFMLGIEQTDQVINMRSILKTMILERMDGKR